MKRIISGKVYDTETATRIGCNYNNCEELYKTENKEWFLVYWRGYAGEDLVVTSESEARDWCEQVVSNSTLFWMCDDGITKDMSEGKVKTSLIKLGE